MPNQSVEKSGSLFKWVIQSGTTSRLPVMRNRYLLGLRYLTVHHPVAKESCLYHICFDKPYTGNQTYLLNGATESSVKCYIVNEGGGWVTGDYSETMEYFNADFTHSDILSLYIVDNDGVQQNVSATLVFDIFPV